MSHHDEDDVRKRAKNARKQIESGGRFKPAPGKYIVRLLKTPADKERNSPSTWMEVQVHQNIGPNKRFARCGNLPGETGKCWLCKKKPGLVPENQIVVQVAVKGPDDDEFTGPLLWEVRKGKTSKALGYKIITLISSDRRDYFDSKNGYNFELERKGVQLETDWSIDPDDKPSKVPSGILKRLKPFVDSGMMQYNEQYLKDAYYGNDDKNPNKENDDMAAKKKAKKKGRAVESDESVSDTSASDVEESDASGSNSSSDASNSDSDASSSDSSSSASESDASGSDASESDASGSDASGSDASESDASESDASGSDASGSDASGSDASEEEVKPKKRKAKAKKEKPAKTAKKKARKTKK